MFFRKKEKVVRDFSDKNLIRRHFQFYGIVQGVGFRYTAAMTAESLNMTGWVRNEYDGSVTMELQGTQVEIDEVLKSLNRSRYIRIERTECRDMPLDEHETSFSTEWY